MTHTHLHTLAKEGKREKAHLSLALSRSTHSKHIHLFFHTRSKPLLCILYTIIRCTKIYSARARERCCPLCNTSRAKKQRENGPQNESTINLPEEGEREREKRETVRCTRATPALLSRDRSIPKHETEREGEQQPREEKRSDCSISSFLLLVVNHHHPRRHPECIIRI